MYNIAVIDNTSNTYDSYLSLLNHVAYYKSTNIFVLDLSKLSKLIFNSSFTNGINLSITSSYTTLYFDAMTFSLFAIYSSSLSKIEGNYMITTKDSAIIAITEIEPSQIGSLIKEME